MNELLLLQTIICRVGTQGTFLAYGVTCIFVFVGYFALNFFYVSKQPLPPPPEDAGAGQTESVYLAPHGVPGGIPRSPSKAKGACGRDGFLYASINQSINQSITGAAYTKSDQQLTIKTGDEGKSTVKSI